MFVPVGKRLTLGKLVNLLDKAHRRIRRKFFCQHFADSRFCRFRQLPHVYIPRICPRPRVRHIKDISDAHPVGGWVQQGNALCAAPDVAVHSAVPELIRGTGACIRALRINHQLVVVGIFIEP